MYKEQDINKMNKQQFKDSVERFFPELYKEAERRCFVNMPAPPISLTKYDDSYKSISIGITSNNTDIVRMMLDISQFDKSYYPKKLNNVVGSEHDYYKEAFVYFSDNKHKHMYWLL